MFVAWDAQPNDVPLTSPSSWDPVTTKVVISPSNRAAASDDDMSSERRSNESSNIDALITTSSDIGPVSVTSVKSTNPAYIEGCSKLDAVEAEFRDGLLDAKGFHTKVAQVLLELHNAHPNETLPALHESGIVSQNFEGIMAGKEPLMQLIDKSNGSTTSNGSNNAIRANESVRANEAVRANESVATVGQLLWCLRGLRIAVGDEETTKHLLPIVLSLLESFLYVLNPSLNVRSKILILIASLGNSALKTIQQANLPPLDDQLLNSCSTIFNSVKMASSSGAATGGTSTTASTTTTACTSTSSTPNSYQVLSHIRKILKIIITKYSLRDQAILLKGVLEKLEQKVMGRHADIIELFELMMETFYPGARDETKVLLKLCSDRPFTYSDRLGTFELEPEAKQIGAALQFICYSINGVYYDAESLVEVLVSDCDSAMFVCHLTPHIPKPPSLPFKRFTLGTTTTTTTITEEQILTHCARGTRIKDPADPSHVLHVDTLISEQISDQQSAVATYRIVDDKGESNVFSLTQQDARGNTNNTSAITNGKLLNKHTTMSGQLGQQSAGRSRTSKVFGAPQPTIPSNRKSSETPSRIPQNVINNARRSPRGGKSK